LTINTWIDKFVRGNPNAIGFEPQRHDDGHLEVIGFTYSSLVRKLSNFGRKHRKK
jgi:hypothetical protein